VTAGSALRPAGEPPALAIRLLNGLSVTREGASIREADLANRRARTLLKVLAVQHGKPVGADQLIDVLWGDAPPQRAADNVAALVSRLRRALGAAAIIGGRDGYLLADEPLVWLDIAVIERLVAEAESRLQSGEPHLAATAAAAALELLGDGRLLPHDDGAWLDPTRAAITTMLARARHGAASAGLQTSDLNATQAAATAALAADGLDEVAARALMLAHARNGEPAKALLGYERLRAALSDELGIDPAAETQAVYLSVLNEQAAEMHSPDQACVAGSRRTADSGLLGRETEVQQLTAAWSQAASGSPSLVVVVGEAGIGKTSLIDELAMTAAATGGLVLRARCYETERSLFLQPIVDALEPAVARMHPAVLREFTGGRGGAFAALFPHAAASLGPASGGHGTAESERRQAYEAVTTLLRRLADPCPVLLVLDDLQNTGLATLELLHYLDRHARQARLLVVAALRSEEGEEALRRLADQAHRLELGPLSAQAVASLADRAGLAAHAADIMSSTHGHPLFVIETMRTLKSGDAGIPESLREAILQRVRRLGPDSEALLRAAAVLGASFEPHLLAGLMQLPEPEAARRCEHLLTSRLVVVAGRSYEFAHDLVHEVLYATTPEPTRLSYHRVAADLINDRPEAVATHAVAIGDWPRAARAWLLAADQAASRNAAADAERLLDHALDAAESAGDLELRARAHLARGRVREVLAAYAEAERDLWAAVELARSSRDPRLEMRALRELGGDATVTLGRPLTGCIELLNDALQIAGSLGDHTAEADVLARLAVIAGSQLQFEESIRFGERAVAAARAADDDIATTIALDGMKTSLAYLGDVERLAPVLDALEPLLRRSGDLFLLQWTVFESFAIPFAKADWPRATEIVQAALELNQQSGRAAYEGWFHAHLGWIARLEGRHAEAIVLGRLALGRVGNQPYSWWNTFSKATLATTLAEAGERDEALALLSEGLQLADRGGAPAYRLRCLALLAQLTGSPEMLADADAMLASVSTPPGHAWLHGIDVYLAVATAHLDHDSVEHAERVIAPVLSAAQTTGSIPALAQASLIEAQCLSARGDVTSARGVLVNAEAIADRHGMRYVADNARRLLASLS
jgi:DNA-binding SARP family transcriptional activator/tetratricopeptide (TPR) repeat protein